ncbi:hypothetical protein ANN_07512 [Periplaneta americana]|uniref:Uncharacterized protein n=1 Tax=Periplaneta americana TaxID=6978 RepID=A0ABQ8SYW8_PERAM|nr:hypothetical protein ANN_07512 [Periplaneta americana]
MDLREVGYDDRDWINLAQARDRWRAYEQDEDKEEGEGENKYADKGEDKVKVVDKEEGEDEGEDKDVEREEDEGKAKDVDKEEGEGKDKDEDEDEGEDYPDQMKGATPGVRVQDAAVFVIRARTRDRGLFWFIFVCLGTSHTEAFA